MLRAYAGPRVLGGVPDVIDHGRNYRKADEDQDVRQGICHRAKQDNVCGVSNEARRAVAARN